MIKQNYIISILGSQRYEEESNEIELTTFGSYINKGNTKYILYNEYDNNYSKSKTTSILKIDGNKKVTLTKNGKERSTLTLESGKRHHCLYNTAAGYMMLGVYTNKIDSNLDDNGGTLEIDYSLDINSDLSSINHILIKIKETKDNDVKDNTELS